jgi:hypothetical protein
MKKLQVMGVPDMAPYTQTLPFKVGLLHMIIKLY